ncbi:MAG: hypothetical protein A2017_00495 [Lentisphaerae bacterium GWF2_44_16]|nr:MAG: hypothetical protein A2017_00495 [Lentisphaerae bacterium GWF2_44_16]
MDYDCIIIGAGFSGLAAGVRLAHFGKKVCICERHSKTGGLNSYYNRSSHELETGLHAMTNFVAPDAPNSSHLLKLLRQLRIPYDTFMLREQNYSSIRFPGKTLRFTNRFEDFEASIADAFPAEIDKFRKFNSMIKGYEDFSFSANYISAKSIIRRYIGDERLLNMLLCPVMFYGSATEDDIDMAQFAVLFKSVFHQGLCRPAEKGVRLLLDILKDRFLNSGGELKLNCGISRLNCADGKIISVETDKGEKLNAANILSSAGHIETLRLCSDAPADIDKIAQGQISFVESIAVTGDCTEKPSDNQTIIYYSDSEDFKFRKPDTLIDKSSGLICFPQNFKFKAEDNKPEFSIRISVPSNYELWNKTPVNEYRKTKAAACSEILRKAEELTGMKDIEKNAILTDTITPKTIYRYSGHLNGAIYGCPDKIKNGKTPFGNLFLCGTDQGLLGITGAMLSGISIANIYLLK